jgi:hypothetical protein
MINQTIAILGLLIIIAGAILIIYELLSRKKLKAKHTKKRR